MTLPPSAAEPRPSAVVAVDIGGTKIATGLVTDAEPATVHARAVRPTRAQEGAEAVMAEVVAAVMAALQAARDAGVEVTAVGVGAPGVVNPSEGVIAFAGPTMPGWGGTPVAARLQEATGLPVAIHNDVRVMGLGEATYGGGRGMQDVLFVSIGTGIGGAFISDGRVPDSPHHCRGEIAYAPCPAPDGSYSFLEEVGAGPKLSAAYCRAAGLAEDALALPAVMERYHAGEDLARTIITERMRCVGRGLAGLVAAVDVSAIVVGGGVGTLGAAIMDPLEEGLRAHLMPYHAELPLSVATLGTNAPLVGAAVLARQARTAPHADA
ncbi:N-acetylglucosamine kinase [Corynebacterium sp. 13CS0277]|uniref:ROK family protein n=1 Tax=Corynebacterium sp. 13CS0277 TaxID=2071994 RepID=UPI000D047519|nr:ROK family protein [Corynebacterium sp. 13CS0277]PRQ12609.1 N-acetylglucosamine kinase [Corynebacterium sp. 13CS0277]